MPEESNVIEFPTPNAMPPARVAPIITYHYAAFRTTKDGAMMWFDGVVNLDAVILSQEQYGNLKKLIAGHYDVPETNIVIVSLVRLDTLNFEASAPTAPQEAQG